ncbi:hypothetical protein AB0J52_32735, partial [Spirillospora sp. NPDC049652]
VVLALRDRAARRVPAGPGGELIDPDDAAIAEDSLEALLRLRYRARMDLGRPEDDYDAMLDDLLKNADS